MQFVEWETEPPKKREPDRSKVEVVHEPIFSWRWWKVGRRGILTSISSDYEWLTPVGTTKVLDDGTLARVAPQNPINRRHYDPESEDWGVYSYKTPAYLREHNQGLFTGQWASHKYAQILVLGKLEAPLAEEGNHIVEHEFGYRSQKVIIQELWVFHRDPEFAFHTAWKKSTENRYECPVHLVPFDRIDGWIRYFSEESDAEDS